MTSTLVAGKDIPGGSRVIDLPVDFVERVECKPDESLEPFLAQNSPLTSHACWVYVHAPSDNQKTVTTDDEAFHKGLSWLRARDSNVTIEDVKAVAHKSGYTCGKWKIRVQENHLLHVWNRIAKAVHSGALKACTGAKVSTHTTQEVRGRGTEHTVYVYVANFLEEETVAELRRELEELLPTVSDRTTSLAQFKPDIFSYMGWGDGKMPPLISVYHSLEPHCAYCGKRAKPGRPKLKACTACRKVRYCDVSCQRKHWKIHKTECKRKSASCKVKHSKNEK